MSNIKTLKAAKVEPNPEVVEGLRELLELAESGDLQAYSISGIHVGGNFLTQWSAGDASMIELIGANAVLGQWLVRQGFDGLD